MLFDLTACVSPDSKPPPSVITTASFSKATFVQDYRASCEDGKSPKWREFAFQSNVPDGTSVEIGAQSGAAVDSLLPAMPVPLATVTTTTDRGPNSDNYDIALIDTGRGSGTPFDAAEPPVISRDVLRISITLNPSSDGLASPTLLAWKVLYDCLDSE